MSAPSSEIGTPIDPGARRQVRARVQALVASLALLAIVLMANYLVGRRVTPWDWTSAGFFTLSDRTARTLRGLEADVDVYVFLSHDEPNFFEVRQLLDQYKRHSSKLKVHYVDPDRDPGRYMKLMNDFRIGQELLASGQVGADVAAVVKAGERKWSVTRQDFVAVDFGGDGEEMTPTVDARTEQALTGAIVEVVEGDATIVCVTEGHGEHSVGSADERGLWALEEDLRRENVELRSLKTMGEEAISADCDALFVLGPERAFGPEEAALLSRYVTSGGSLLLALDPVFAHDAVQSTGLESVASEVGIDLTSAIVLELEPDLLPPPGSPLGPMLVGAQGDHAIVKPIAGVGGLLALETVRALEVRSGASALLKTSDKSYAEARLAGLPEDTPPAPGEDDLRGPVIVAAAAETGVAGGEARAPGDRSRGRVVVVGDADWLTSEYLRHDRLVNYHFAGAVTGWLTEREALISIAPKRVDAKPFLISEGDWWGFVIRVVGVMPGAALLAGLFVWWQRRK